MAYKHDDVIVYQHEQLVAERAAAVAQYESGRVNEDHYTTLAGANAILEADAKLEALGRIANNYVAGQQRAQPTNKYGLSRDEIAIARGNGSNDPRLTNDDRDRIYAEQKNKYQRLRSTGEYRDDQGMVRR